jgi:AcrR family transcriptional regulator
MSIPRQEGSVKTGRVNQKRRTRQAIVTAATEFLQQGTTPTVAQAAEAALVSRTTAYRYFPTQESLLVEVAVNVDVDDIEALVARPPDGDGPGERVVALIDLLNQHAFAAEAQYRTALRLYLDLWLTAAANGDDEPVVREGRRRRWIEQTLAPLHTAVADADLDRLVAALSLLAGAEAVVVLRDVCQLAPEEGRAVTGWAAQVLVDATLRDHVGTPRTERSRRRA